MLRTLKWVYNLGVRHERRRIATYLSNAQARRYDLDPFEHNRRAVFEKDIKEEDQRKADFKRAVDAEVVSIINQLFEPNQEFRRGDASFIFPDGEDK